MISFLATVDMSHIVHRPSSRSDQPNMSISIGLSVSSRSPQINGKIKGYWSADQLNRSHQLIFFVDVICHSVEPALTFCCKHV